MPTQQKILVIDDEPKILTLIESLMIDNYEVVTALNGAEGLKAAKNFNPDLIILDRLMPEMDGIEACRELRDEASTQQIPIIMLTALKESSDRIEAFNAGVDDFISKPFHPDELLTRVNAKLKRFNQLRNNSLNTEIICKNLVMDVATKTVQIDNVFIHLTETEFDILHSLLEKRNRILSRSDLVKKIWNQTEVDDRILDCHIVSLRKKIKNFELKIKTLYGRGYVISE